MDSALIKRIKLLGTEKQAEKIVMNGLLREQK